MRFLGGNGPHKNLTQSGGGAPQGLFVLVPLSGDTCCGAGGLAEALPGVLKLLDGMVRLLHAMLRLCHAGLRSRDCTPSVKEIFVFPLSQLLINRPSTY
jgi:hypothetical protein